MYYVSMYVFGKKPVVIMYALKTSTINKNM